MKKLILINACVLILFGFKLNTTAQELKPKQNTDKIYIFESVINDPLNTRIYTLKNGLKVFMTVYKDEPRIQTMIVVKAGSKHDPAETTGLAHYFEHMMFKGTNNLGTTDYEKESVLIAQIDSLFEVYRTIKDDKERRDFYRIIDSVSIVASKYAIPSEYDKIMAHFGTTGTNAYTSLEETVYIENIPSNQLENWAIVQTSRFSSIVLRLFHTELETVYEEKNMTLTSDPRKAFIALLEGIFPTHPYGTQTVIGTQEHLKNPSMKNIRWFFHKYYVPNNMAICLSGDFDPDEAIKIIDNHFGNLKPGEIPEFTYKKMPDIKEPMIKEVFGPDAESITLGYRLPGARTEDILKLKMFDMLLTNNEAGLIDLNLNQKQKVLEATTSPYILGDYSVMMLQGKPKENQTLDEVKELILEQVALLKKGEFDDWLLDAIVNDLKLQQIRSFEDNSSRARAYVDAFVKDIPWDEYVTQLDRMSEITKDDIIKFANKYFENNFVAVYKRTGKDETFQKIPKNKITPVKIERDEESEFFKKLKENKVEEIEPVFLDYEKDIIKFKTSDNISVYYVKNTENPTFDMYYVFNMGTNHNIKLEHAIEYLEFIGTSEYAPDEIKKEFYKLACSYKVFTSDDQVYVQLSGLSENFEKAIKLFEHLLSDAQYNLEAWNSYVDRTLTKRADAKKNIQYIFNYLFYFGIYGDKGPHTNILPEKELKKLDPGDIINLVHSLTSYEHRVFYYGSHSSDDLKEYLKKYHKIPDIFIEIPEEKVFEQQPTEKNQVYFVNFDIPQTFIIVLSRVMKNYREDTAPILRLFNEYFGMGMNSIVFQEIRESRGLAYLAMSFIQEPQKKDEHYYKFSLIGTQFDKVKTAIDGFYELFNDLPVAESTFNLAKESIVQSLRSERITKSDILFNYERARKIGLNEDIRKKIFYEIPNLTFEDINKFHSEHVKDKTHTILVLGNKKDVPQKTLKQYGKFKRLKMSDIFGY